MSQQSALPRASTFTVPSSQRGLNVGGNDRPHGSYNSRRDVPPPSVGGSSASSSAFTSTRAGAGGRYVGGSVASTGDSETISGAAMRTGTRAGKASTLFTQAMVMVDEATEPGISDEDGIRRCGKLVALVQTGGDPRYGSVVGNSPGAAVAHALRKRLKSDDHVAVLNCLTLLDELMRYCPYFYRYIANEKFFRRLWRFVDPEYKPDPRGRLPFSTSSKMSKMVAATRSSAVNIELAERVLILIRAWAEELSIMFSGQQDPDAGFFIERYSNKRMRIKFPDVPSTSTPWVCPVGTSAGRSRFASYGGQNGGRRGTTTTTKSPLPKSLSLGEIENTVNLFSNLLEKATDISDVQGDLCTDLADRCRLISQHIDTLSATMEKDEDISRAIKVSERLQSTLEVYDVAIASGAIYNAPAVVVDGLSSDGNSVDEGYDVGPSAYNDYPPTAAYKGDRDDRGDEGNNRRREPSVGSSSSAAQDRRRSMDGEEHVGERPRVNGREKSSSRKREKKESLKLATSSSKSSVKSAKSSAKKESSKQAVAKAAEVSEPPSLVDVADPASTKSSSSDSSVEKKDSNAFNILEKRYTSNKSNKSNKSNRSSKARAVTPDLPASNMQSTAVVPGFAGMSLAGPAAPPPSGFVPQAAQSSPQIPPTRAAPQQQQQTQQFPPQPQQSQMPYGSVMMMPNPMAMSMYGSYNPAMMQQQQPYGAMPSAYNTINPGMYYNTVNPLAYASVGVSAPNPSHPVPSTASPMHSQTMPQIPMPQAAQVPPSAPQTRPQQAQSTLQQAPQAPQPRSHQVPQDQLVMQQMSQVQPPTQEPPQAQSLSQQQQPIPGFGMNMLAVPPPPPLPSAYTTVTNAPAPPPLEPPPPASPSHPTSPPAPAAAPAAASVSAAAPAAAPAAAAEDQTRKAATEGQIVASEPVLAPHAHQQQMPPPSMQQPGFNPALYGSVSGQPGMQSQSFLYASNGQPQFQASYPGMNAPVATPAVAQYPSMTGVPAMAASMPMENNPQAMAYQNAMANAAAAYHAAATAYQSVQGQAPLQPTGTNSSHPDPSSLSPNVSQ